MSRDVVIECHNLGKSYRIFKRPEDRLKQMIWRNRRKYYDEFWALDQVSLSISRGETVGIIGRNGSGKSTLLQIVCGTLAPTSGTISVHGRVAALLELGAGFNPEFTGRENVYLAASVLGLSTPQIAERYESIVEFAGIGDFVHQPVKLYSSGMYARLAFAVAAHVDADILIVDEILAVGDAAFQQRCMKFIRQFRENGTLLFVSHDTGSVLSLCDRAVWLDSGYLRESGSAKAVCHNYLAALNNEMDNVNTFKIGGSRKAPPTASRIDDHRRNLLRESTLRNDIELFDFDPDAPWFGHRGASITEVRLEQPSGSALTLLEGGEEVVLRITGVAHQQVSPLIIGFFVKNHLGQHLFGDNTYLTYCEAPVMVPPGATFSATFHFQLPYLPTGDYSVLASIAEGTQAEHRQHHWVDDALFFKVHSSHVARGLIGVPMIQIEFHGEIVEHPLAQSA